MTTRRTDRHSAIAQTWRRLTARQLHAGALGARLREQTLARLAAPDGLLVFVAAGYVGGEVIAGRSKGSRKEYYPPPKNRLTQTVAGIMRILGPALYQLFAPLLVDALRGKPGAGTESAATMSNRATREF
jgi:hypothetical protein